MLLLISGATATIRKLPASAPVGHLITPHTGNSLEAILATGRLYGADNGCGPRRDGTPGELDSPAFWAMLREIARAPLRPPLFVVVPDAVGDATETLRLWRYYHGGVAAASGARLAFVAQDGCEQPGMIPWNQFSTLFIGGSTAWKEGPAARAVIREAKQRGKRVHVGRVNSERRLRLFDDLGSAADGYPYQIDTIDGTQFSMFPDTYIPRWAERLAPTATPAPVHLGTLPLFQEAA